ncbi:ubiquitin-like-conjugating enzyme ATG10 [Euphorbia lathyris]|uniref:ubiquitin-like-conjugating enzyme ATG10 n=1 Tax=Euphorbia lathyris TaxID=212925 RepID=UPI003313C2D2
MDISSWDGTLSPNDYCVAAHAFSERWKQCNSASPPWFWVNSKKRPFLTQQVDGFLSLEKICLIKPIEDNHEELSSTEEEDTGFSEITAGIDDATLVHNNQHQAHFYDFHIVYSASYKVPVLYFRGYCSDGRPLLLDEIEMDLPTCSSKVLLESKWTFITQEEHPWLNRPWYKLHPCGTSEWMKLLFLGDAAMAEKRIQLYLVSWFSVVGQVVGLRTPMEMVHDYKVICDFDCNALGLKNKMNMSTIYFCNFFIQQPF